MCTVPWQCWLWDRKGGCRRAWKAAAGYKSMKEKKEHFNRAMAYLSFGMAIAKCFMGPRNG